MRKLPLLCLSVGITFLAICTSEEIDDTIINDCTDGSWALSQVALELEGSNLIITADVAQGQASNSTVRQIQIMLTGCDIFLRCSNFGNSSVSDVDCQSNDISDFDLTACDLAQALGEWELVTGNFSTRHENGDSMDLCFYYDDELNLVISN